jgi:hypothetical protein
MGCVYPAGLWSAIGKDLVGYLSPTEVEIAEDLTLGEVVSKWVSR